MISSIRKEKDVLLSEEIIEYSEKQENRFIDKLKEEGIEESVCNKILEKPTAYRNFLYSTKAYSNC